MIYLQRISLLLLIISLHLSSQGKDLYLKDFYKPGNKDATPAVFQMLQEARKYENVRVFIEEGEYHFYPEKAFEKYCYVSNHDNTMRRIAFPIIGFDGLNVIGQNARFIFHGPMMPFDIEDSKNIKVSGISIDWHIPLHSEAIVLANNPVEGTFDLQISKDYPYVVRNNKLFFIKEGYEHDLGRAILFDPKRKAVAYNTRKYTPVDVINRKVIQNKEKIEHQNYIDENSPNYVYQNAEWALKTEEIEPGLVRIKTSKELPPAGTILVCKGRNGNNRIANAFHIHKSSNVELENINIYHAGGMGVLGERSQNIALKNIKVRTNPDDTRMVSTSADATHFVNCKGTITIDGCEFRNMLDDATNVHGTFIIVDEVLAPNKLGIRVGHYQQAGFVFAEKGDRIGIINPKTSALPLSFGTVKEFEVINERYYIITFDKALNKPVSKGFVLENCDWYPELTITNCVVADNRARGFLLSSPKKTVIENNYFSTMMSAILIPVELSWWYESGQPQNITIRNNTFGDCCYGGNKCSVISIHTSLDKTDYIFGKIVIEGNEFNHFDSAILQANGVKELSFINNTISTSGTFKPLFPKNSVLSFDHVGKLKIDNIQFNGKLKEKVSLNNVEIKDLNF